MDGDGDGWATCRRGHRHWGRHGAAGLLLRHRPEAGPAYVLLQHRARWSHHGGTWGLPGGARDSHESTVEAALREAAEETGLRLSSTLVRAEWPDDHGGWAYVTVVAEAAGLLPARPVGAESLQLRWVPEPEVAALPLHPGFAVTWPTVRLL